MRRRCMAGTSDNAGVSSPVGSQGAFAHACHCAWVVMPGAHAAQSITENSIIPANMMDGYQEKAVDIAWHRWRRRERSARYHDTLGTGCIHILK